MSFGNVHRPGDFVAPPSELPVAGAPSPLAFRRFVKRRLFSRSPAGVDEAWRVDREVDRLLSVRLLHLVWALGIQVDAAADAGLRVQARGWLSGLATASALGLTAFDPVILGLSGADGTEERSMGAARLDLAVPPEQVGRVTTWLLDWGRRRRRRFTVALVAPSGRMLPFDWEPIEELARPHVGPVRALTLAWVPDERVVQIPWGETRDGYPVALLPPVHLRSSGVHLVTVAPDELLGAAERRRPAGADELRRLEANVLAGADPRVYEELARGWIPPALADEVPVLARLAREERPAMFAELLNLVALADDELRRGYFLERYQARRGGAERRDDELPREAMSLVSDTRGILMFVEQVAALVAAYSGWDTDVAFRLASQLAEGLPCSEQLDRAFTDAAERGGAPDDVRRAALAVQRWGPLALSKRLAASRAALAYELTLLKTGV